MYSVDLDLNLWASTFLEFISWGEVEIHWKMMTLCVCVPVCVLLVWELENTFLYSAEMCELWKPLLKQDIVYDSAILCENTL